MLEGSLKIAMVAMNCLNAFEILLIVHRKLGAGVQFWLFFFLPIATLY